MKILLIGSGRKLTQEVEKLIKQYPNEYLQIISVDKTIKSYKSRNILSTVKCHTEKDMDYDYDFKCLNNNKQYELLQYDVNIFDFLEIYKEKDIDLVEAIRVFEHIEYEKIPYLLYLLSEVCKKQAILNVVVPDFCEISKSLIQFENDVSKNIDASNFNRSMIDLHTEIFNTVDDPHRSIWTSELILYYLNLEKFWKIDVFENSFNMDNRKWYIYFSCYNLKE